MSSTNILLPWAYLADKPRDFGDVDNRCTGISPGITGYCFFRLDAESILQEYGDRELQQDEKEQVVVDLAGGVQFGDPPRRFWARNPDTGSFEVVENNTLKDAIREYLERAGYMIANFPNAVPDWDARCVEDVTLYDGGNTISRGGPGYHGFCRTAESLLMYYGNRELTALEKAQLVVDIVREFQFGDPPRRFWEYDDEDPYSYRAVKNNQVVRNSVELFLERANYNANYFPRVVPEAYGESAKQRFLNLIGLRRQTNIVNRTDRDINLVLSYMPVTVEVQTRIEAGVSVPYATVGFARTETTKRGPQPPTEAVVLARSTEPFELFENKFFLSTFTRQTDGTIVIHLKNQPVRGYQDWEILKNDLLKVVARYSPETVITRADDSCTVL